jgi:hypothetical protein
MGSLKPPYTRAQIQAASPKKPAPISAYSHNHYRAFDALTAILTGDKPTMQHWGELANIANIMVSLCMQNQISDPQGLIHDAVIALGKARQRETIRLDGPGRNALIMLLDQYVDLCKNIPERTIKSAVNYAFNCQQQTRNL